MTEGGVGAVHARLVDDDRTRNRRFELAVALRREVSVCPLKGVRIPCEGALGSDVLGALPGRGSCLGRAGQAEEGRGRAAARPTCSTES
jgi:hypothetical protein